MPYCDFSAHPWDVWDEWLRTSFGTGSAQISPNPPPTTAPLAVLRDYKLDSKWPKLGPMFNPSVFVWDGVPWAIVRTQIGGHTRNLIGPLAGWPNGADELRSTLVTQTGFEDCRGIVVDGKLVVIASVAMRKVTSGVPAIRIGVCDAERDGRGRINVVRARVIESPRLEKNWMPAATPAGLRLVYSVAPLTVVDPSKNLTDRDIARLEVPKMYRGSSQVIPWRGQWLAIVHQVHWVKGAAKPIYLHRFVAFDPEFRRLRVGGLWHFRQPGVEFCAGLAEHGGRLYISYGVRDEEAWIAEVDPARVDVRRV